MSHNPHQVETGPENAAERPHRLDEIETYRKIPIYHLVYEGPVMFDRKTHEEEIRIIASISAERFGLVICVQNLSIARDYSTEAQAEVYTSSPMEGLRGRAVAVARYNPGSLASMVRTMTAHLYLRQAMAAEFAPDLETALRVVRRGIDQFVEGKSTVDSRQSTADGTDGA